MPTAALAFQQTNLRRLLAFAVVSHTSLLVIGLFSLHEAGIQGTVLLAANFGLDELSFSGGSDGDVSNASVTRSSGDAPFDNSAVAAVRNVGRIPEMQQLDGATFNAMYRQRRMIFKPEDLSL